REHCASLLCVAPTTSLSCARSHTACAESTIFACGCSRVAWLRRSGLLVTIVASRMRGVHAISGAWDAAPPGPEPISPTRTSALAFDMDALPHLRRRPEPRRNFADRDEAAGIVEAEC